MKPTREEQFNELQRIARIHLGKRGIVDAYANTCRFNEIAESKMPFAKNAAMQAIDRDKERMDIESRFAAIAAPIGNIGTWLPKRVIVLGERDAIVEYVSNADSNVQKVGEVNFMTVVNDECSRIIHNQLDHALLHYLSVKHEGHSAAFEGSFVRYGLAMLGAIDNED